MEEIEIDVPCHFLCPISLQLMVDPVTVSTGITFDRSSIETWLHSCRRSTCPVTKQDLSGADLTPNHTLRRLIQSWSVLHAPERVPTPKPQVSRNDVVKLLNDARRFPAKRATCLRRLRSIVLESDRNRKLLEGSGAVEFLGSVVVKNDAVEESSCVVDEALTILYHVKPGDEELKRLSRNDGVFTDSLARVLSRGTHNSRAYAILLLKSVYDVADPIRLVTAKPEIFAEVVRVLRDRVSHVATKAALKLLIELCPWGRNRIKAVENGAVSALVDLLLDTCEEKRTCELLLTATDQLCGCAEGRAELVRHAAGLAVVSKKVLRVSHAATDRAVRVLSSVARRSGTGAVLQEMLAVGVVAKLCLVLQVDSSVRAKEWAREILRLHSRVWRGSSCIPPHLLSSYPMAP